MPRKGVCRYEVFLACKNSWSMRYEPEHPMPWVKPSASNFEYNVGQAVGFEDVGQLARG